MATPISDWSSPSNRERSQAPAFAVGHDRGYLPAKHRDQPGMIAVRDLSPWLILFRAAPALPIGVAMVFRSNDNLYRRLQLDIYLDCGRGECYLCCAKLLLSCVAEGFAFSPCITITNCTHGFSCPTTFMSFTVCGMSMSPIVENGKSLPPTNQHACPAAWQVLVR